MLKLIRNAIADKQIIYDLDNNRVEWRVFRQPHALQENEGLHLANNMRGACINSERQKMKVRLASRLLCRSIGVSFKICQDPLKLP